MSNKFRLKRLEQIMGYKEKQIFVIIPAILSKNNVDEVIVNGGKTISMEEYAALNPGGKMIVVGE